MEGGLPGEMQFTPDSCELTLAVVGILPGMTIDSVVEDISATVAEALTGHQDTEFEVAQLPGSLFVDGTEPVPMQEEPNASLAAAYREVLGDAPIPNRKNAFNDTIRFREAGMNAVTFGPGEDGWSPVNESISITKSVAAMKVLALAIPNILGIAE